VSIGSGGSGSRYEWFRKRLALVAVIIAVLVLVHEAFKSKDVSRAQVELRFGAHAAEVEHVRARIMVDGEQVGDAERDFTADQSTIRFPAELGGDRASIVVDLDTTRGHRRFEHALTRGDVVIVDLGPDLDREPR
jgi:hypothetical protein